MLTESTAEKVSLVLAVIRWNQLKGNIPADRPVSTAAMAEVAKEIGLPVSEQTFRRVAQIALAKAKLRALELESQTDNP
jgi:hypothetical protein